MKVKQVKIFSKHALEQIERRGLSKQTIDDVLEFPSSIIKEDADVEIYQKLVFENGRHYLYRVFVNRLKIPPLVITSYKTSKTDKYENQI